MNLTDTYNFIIILTFLLFATFSNKLHSQSAQRELTQQEAGLPSGESLKHTVVTYRLVQGINETWGYDILVDNKLTIHQPCKPGLPGHEGFNTREGAKKVAKLVVEKMKKGEMPPAVTEAEMKRLKAL